MLSAYKERAPETCQMTAEVSEISETLNKLNLVSIRTLMKLFALLYSVKYPWQDLLPVMSLIRDLIVFLSCQPISKRFFMPPISIHPFTSQRHAKSQSKIIMTSFTS